MVITDQLKEKLKNLEPHIKVIKDYWTSSNMQHQLDSLTKESEDPEFWKNPQGTQILKDIAKLRNISEQYHSILKTYSELNELLDLFESDEAETANLGIEINRLIKQTLTFKIDLLLTSEYDHSNCFLNINSGAGGTESQDWADMLLRMYLRFCEQNKLHASILEYQAGEEAGIKSATLYIKGNNAYGLLKSEHGIHRLVRISPFDANKRRHTSFASVTITPELPPSEKIEIEPKDLRIDTYRASGAGGQHVNKTESAVRITHLPTGIVVQCQIERSQIQNRETAMKMLMAKLRQKQRLEEEAKTTVEKKKAEWGSQIRSYILHPYKMVKDHRTGMEHFQPELVLDGDLIGFIESYLVAQAAA
ncbi:MAG TPA: peptide chain release factor 2 [Candidatus Saccharimonadales bacterium]|nr:peptide chain release factor 2 [Candidatus Saccharimonadales bacterium]